MNWIIQNSDKLEFHTNLKEILKPILDVVKSFNWVISDFDFTTDKELPINHNRDFFVLSDQEFNKILNSDVQFIWGVISGFGKDEEIIIDKNNLPFAEGNDLIWENGNIQISNSIMEIIAFDSTFTIIKFKDKNLSDIFKEYFDEAIALEKFNS